MSETVKFHAKASRVTGGGDDVRVVLELKDSPIDIGAAVSLFGMLKRVLHVAAYCLKDETSFAEFRATIPELQTGISINSNGSNVVKLDVPASDRLQALRLIGYNDKFIRIEIEDEGEKAKKAPKEAKPKEPKGPHGQLWKELYLSGFVNMPGIRESVEEVREMPEQSAWDALHAVFGGVESLALVGPEQIFLQFPPNEYPAVKTIVEQALRKANKQ